MNTTNAKLEEIDFFEDRKISAEEFCEALGVDAILKSRFSLDRPMSVTGSIAIGLILPVTVSPNSASVII